MIQFFFLVTLLALGSCKAHTESKTQSADFDPQLQVRTHISANECQQIKAEFGIHQLEETGMNICACPQPRFRDRYDYIQCLVTYGVLEANLPASFSYQITDGYSEKRMMEQYVKFKPKPASGTRPKPKVKIKDS
jgi:hypothetical protein